MTSRKSATTAPSRRCSSTSTSAPSSRRSETVRPSRGRRSRGVPASPSRRFPQALQSLLDAGLVREADHDPDGPSYGAVFFEPVPDAALVLGLDLGARFLRGAICDLSGRVRARQDVELEWAERGRPARDHSRAQDLARSMPLAFPQSYRTAPWWGSLESSIPQTRRYTSRRMCTGSKAARSATSCASISDSPFSLRTMSIWPRSASIGWGSRAGSTTSCSSPSGPAWAQVCSSGGELHHGHHGAAGELDYALGGSGTS